MYNTLGRVVQRDHVSIVTTINLDPADRAYYTIFGYEFFAAMCNLCPGTPFSGSGQPLACLYQTLYFAKLPLLFPFRSNTYRDCFYY